MSLVLKDEWGVIRWERAEQSYFSQKIQRYNQKQDVLGKLLIV